MKPESLKVMGKGWEDIFENYLRNSVRLLQEINLSQHLCHLSWPSVISLTNMFKLSLVNGCIRKPLICENQTLLKAANLIKSIKK